MTPNEVTHQCLSGHYWWMKLTPFSVSAWCLALAGVGAGVVALVGHFEVDGRKLSDGIDIGMPNYPAAGEKVVDLDESWGLDRFNCDTKAFQSSRGTWHTQEEFILDTPMTKAQLKLLTSEVERLYCL